MAGKKKLTVTTGPSSRNVPGGGPAKKPTKKPKFSDTTGDPYPAAQPHRAPLKPLEQRINTDVALRKRVLENPGLRMRLSDSALGKYAPDLLQKRQKIKATRDIGDLDTPLSGDTLVNVATSLTNQSFNPLYKDLDRQESRVGARQKAQAGFAQDYTQIANDSVQSALNDQIQANARARQQTNDATKAASDAIDQAAQEATARQQQDQSVRGAGLDGGGIAELAARVAEAKGRAATEGQAAGDRSQAIGDNYAGFLNASKGINESRGLDTQADIRNQGNADLAKLASDRSKLRSDQEGKLTETLLTLRGSEGDRLLAQRTLADKHQQAILDAKLAMEKLKSDSQIAQANRDLQLQLKELGISADQAKQEADQIFKQRENKKDRKARQVNSEANRKQDAKEKQLDREAAVRLAKLQAELKKKGGGKDPFTPTQIRGNKNALQSAQTLAGTLKSSVDDGSMSVSAAITALSQQTKNDLAARIAFYRIIKGGKIPYSLRKQAVEQLGFDPGA